MANEAAAAVGTTATLTPLVDIYYDGIHESTSLEVIQNINECVSLDQQIELDLAFTDSFDATEAMQNKIVEASSHIKKISIYHCCNDNRGCFNFFIRIIQGIIGIGKVLKYDTYKFEFELEQANQLAQAIVQSNNNNSGSIESFHLNLYTLTTVVVQPVLDALLDSGVRKIHFENDDTADPPINDNNNRINFTGMETNISLKELHLNVFDMQEEDFRNLFHAIKKNKGLEELTLNYRNHQYLPTRMMRLFEEMMCENITLLHCSLYVGVEEEEQDEIFEMIQFYTEMNRMWKRYMMKCEREKKTRSVITRIEERDNNDNDNNNNEEEERKKRLKMRLLLHLFMEKPVMRDTVIFHLLREYPDDLVSNNNSTNNEHPQQNPLLLRIINSNLAAKNNRKSTTDDDGDNQSNDGTDDNDDDSASASIFVHSPTISTIYDTLI